MPNDLIKLEGIKEIAEALSIKDATQPAMTQIGQASGTITHVFNTLLVPVEIFNAWADAKKSRFIADMTERLSKVPEEDRERPKKRVFAGALRGAIIAEDDQEETLRDLFFNLMASSADRKVSQGAHPSFIDILSQLTSDEAKIIAQFTKKASYPLVHLNASRKLLPTHIRVVHNFTLLPYIAGCEHPELGCEYIENLIRLGIVASRVKGFLYDKKLYDEVQQHPFLKPYIDNIEKEEYTEPSFQVRMLDLTTLGKLFITACIAPLSSDN